MFKFINYIEQTLDTEWEFLQTGSHLTSVKTVLQPSQSSHIYVLLRTHLLFLPRSARARAATTTWSRFPLVWVCSRGPWHWLTSRAAAEEMAEKVARWP